jgi:hypothetical protein
MRKILALFAVGLSTLIAAPAMSADMPYYPDIEVPDVDYGLEGGFYLRGSVAGNVAWARDFNVVCGCAVGPHPFQIAGYGYSFGAGIGYEMGDGLRADVTIDYLDNSGLKGNIGNSGSTSTYRIRGGVALANAYYDIPLGGAAAQGGFSAYFGGGLGLAYYEVSDIGLGPDPTGTGVTGAAAAMVGVSYDLGSAVADLGYRALYLPTINNQDVTNNPIVIRDAMIHELRGTVRYRFN